HLILYPVKEMGVVGALKNIVQMWRSIVFSIQTFYRWIYNHALVLVAVFFLCTVYRFFPSVLRFFISSSPIFICTAVLLNILLSFGSPNNPEAEEKRIHAMSSLNGQDIEKDDRYFVESRARKRSDVKERALEIGSFPIGGKALSSKDKKVSFSTKPYEGFIRRTVRIEERPPEIPQNGVDGFEVQINSDDAESSNFGSDQATCSSPDTPPADLLPVIDENDPLLDPKYPQLARTSTDEFDATLDCSDRSLDGSADSETENHEEKHENEEDGAKSVFSWTEDDEKNLMDLGTSELERDQRLEKLIAKRRARQNFSKVVEKNLIDFDSNDAPVHIPSITTVKTNPFEVPYNSSMLDGLPPVPASAPSVLVPRGNPFDIPYDPQEEKPNLTEDSFHQEFMSVFQKDMYLSRHESFSLGPSFMGGLKQERNNTKFDPYYAAEASLQTEYSRLHGKLGEKVISGLVSVPESESPSPPTDREIYMAQTEQIFSQGALISQTNHNFDLIEKERKSSTEVDLMKSGKEAKGDADLNKVEIKGVGKEISLPDRLEAFIKSEVVEEKCHDSSDSSSAGINEEVSRINIEEVRSKDIEPSITDLNNPYNEPNGPSLSLEVSEINSRVMEDDDAHTKEPVYDSSPSAVEKRTIDEYLNYSVKGHVLTTSSSVASDMQVEVSEAGSPREPYDRYLYADGESSFLGGIDENGKDPGNEVKEKELRPVETTESSEDDAVKVGVKGYDTDLKWLVEDPTEPKFVVEQFVNSSNSALPPVNDALPSSTEPEAHIAFKHPDSEVLESIIRSPSSNLENRELVPDNLTVQPSPEIDRHEESQETILVSSEGASIIDSVNVNEVLFNDKKNIYERISSENIQGDDSGSSKAEVLINEPDPTDAALMDVKASDRGHETADNVIEQQVSEASKEEDKASKLPQEEVALMDVEASDRRRVHETSNNLIERQVSEASNEDHKASKQPHKEVELDDVEASDRLHESTDIVIERQESEASQEEDKASKQPQEEVALIAVEASDRVHETRNNLFERQDSEASDEEHKASKQPHKEVELVDVEASDRLHKGTNNVIERQVSEASHEEYKATTQPHEEVELVHVEASGRVDETNNVIEGQMSEASHEDTRQAGF
ncbi:hypothetical protein IFM89_031499, partial [Coptis chinensis]